VRQLCRHKSRLDDNIKVDIRETIYGFMDWIRAAQNMDHWWVLLNTVMSILVP
jgi:hypothetical protein